MKPHDRHVEQILVEQFASNTAQLALCRGMGALRLTGLNLQQRTATRLTERAAVSPAELCSCTSGEILGLKQDFRF